MKRTQSKAVKPARKGAVKVPKGWRKLRVGERIHKGDQYLAFGILWDDCLCPRGHNTKIKKDTVPVIRRNPRAARAKTKGAE